MLQLTRAGKRFGHKLLFEKIDWQITPGERTGLVGGNGTGKSTLLRILAGLDSLDDGSMESTGGMTFGYLPQDGLQLQGRSVFDECLSAFARTQALEHKIQHLHSQLAELPPLSGEYAAVIEQLARSDAEFHALDGYTIEARVGTVLSGLGFSKDDWQRKTEEFSGGWQMRIALAKLLLEKPDLLLLDEPTNHLDLEARNWLEGYLHAYPHAYVLVSHDRFFLDIATDKIVELWNHRLYSYTGNYEKYLQQKAERQVQMEAAYRHQREHIEHLESFITRFRAQATKARQVQSRIKELERIERIELPPAETEIHFTFPQPPASGRTVAEAHQISKSYGTKEVFSGVQFTIERGERIALVGPNGQGKSTLLKMLAGVETPDRGRVEQGHNVALGYFAQHHIEGLDLSHSILQAMESAAPPEAFPRCRSILGAFLFSGDAVDKKISVLSGGEKHRVALAQLLLKPTNVLLLDEPTNHLDMESRAVLEDALDDYEGTVIFVSHDRGFINNVATKVIHIADRKADEYFGNYEDYSRKRLEEKAALEARKKAAERDAQSDNKPLSKKEERRRAAELRQELHRRVGPLKKKVKDLEATIERLEEQKEGLETKLADVEFYQQGDPEDFAKATQQFQQVKTSLEAAYASWESAAQEISEAEADLLEDA